MLDFNKLFLFFLCINLSVNAMQNADHIITEGTEEQIIALLQNGYQYKAKILYKSLEWPLLYIATLRGQVEVIKYLQSQGVDINAPTTEGQGQGFTPMHIAAANGQIEVIKYLQSQGVNINAPMATGPGQGLTPMHVAASTGQIEAIKYLQSQGVDINAPVTEGPHQGYTPMHKTAALGQVEVIKYLQSLGVGINSPITAGPHQGLTPMHIAAAKGQFEVIKYLQSQHIDINAPITEGPGQGYTPMHMAASNGQVEVIKYLQSQHIDINALIAEGPEQGLTPMHIAAYQGQIEVIKHLQSQGVDVNAKIARKEDQEKGLTALCLATRGSLPAIQTLVWLGAQLDHLGPDSNTSASEYAEMAGNAENALYLTKIAPHTQSLLALCLQLNKYRESLCQVLSEENISYTELAAYAASKRSIPVTIGNLLSSIFNLLVPSRLPSENALDAKYSKASTHFSLCEKSAAAIRKELDYSWCGCGAEINAIDRFGKTPLHYCIQFYDPKAPTSFDELAKDIIKKGAKVNIVDREGFTPLGRACLYGNYRLARLLLSQDKEHRADPTIGINPLSIVLTTSNWPLMNVLLSLAHDQEQGHE
jgi:ankyrin repeat protein